MNREIYEMCQIPSEYIDRIDDLSDGIDQATQERILDDAIDQCDFEKYGHPGALIICKMKGIQLQKKLKKWKEKKEHEKVMRQLWQQSHPEMTFDQYIQKLDSAWKERE